jgi:hypothetical protein
VRATTKKRCANYLLRSRIVGFFWQSPDGRRVPVPIGSITLPPSVSSLSPITLLTSATTPPRSIPSTPHSLSRAPSSEYEPLPASAAAATSVVAAAATGTTSALATTTSPPPIARPIATRPTSSDLISPVGSPLSSPQRHAAAASAGTRAVNPTTGRSSNGGKSFTWDSMTPASASTVTPTISALSAGGSPPFQFRSVAASSSSTSPPTVGPDPHHTSGLSSILSPASVAESTSSTTSGGLHRRFPSRNHLSSISSPPTRSTSPSTPPTMGDHKIVRDGTTRFKMIVHIK